MIEDECEWVYENSDISEFIYNTACGESGVTKEDDYKFCPYCGAPLKAPDNG